MALLLPLLVVVLVLLAVLAAASTLRYGTWRKKGVPHLTPVPLFGNATLSILQREALFGMLDRVYRHFPGQPYAGFYAGPSPVLLVRSVEAVKNMLVKDFNVFPNHKLSPAPQYDEVFSKFLFCLPGEQWKDVRTKMTSAFTSGQLKAMYPSVKAMGEDLVRNIKQHRDKNGVIPVSNTCTRYGLDVIARCAFGIDGGALKTREPSPYMKAVGEAFRFGVSESLASFALLFSPLLYHVLRYPLLKEWRSAIIRNLLLQTSEVREKAPLVNKDIFDKLLTLKQNGSVSYDVFEAQVMSMQVAGSESTASTVMFALWMLARHPECQEKLRAELRETVGNNGGEISYETGQDTKYLDMVMKETLRLWPVMPWLDRVATQDYVLPDSDIKIEKGTVVMVPVYSIHRDPEHYADPDKFDPERWAPENADNINKLAFLPFGTGPRACIGLRFADMSVKSALSHILLNFRVSLAADSPASDAELQICPRSFIITIPKDLPLSFEPL
ncbi:cytochrome P450 6j1-like [Thrips palmi]|uniref:Cytochrome P450 6j1-like n=1 Tax=Thrips palmi TaxID=161013 RepID=A0A6P8YLK6_THRPL|nr:cytochrome P450 6j1-like [Thrips palmi]XP_034237986.1 cytochrome P450 6j1-like [Thrips palmi]